MKNYCPRQSDDRLSALTTPGSWHRRRPARPPGAAPWFEPGAWLVLGVCLTVLLGGCKRQGAMAAAGPPVIQVVVVEAKRQAVYETLALPATIAPNETVELKS